MKKKISLLLCLVMMALGLCACGEDPTTVDYYGMSYQDLELTMTQVADSLGSISAEELEYLEASGDEIMGKLASTWNDTVADLGEYQGIGEFTLTKAQETITLDQIVHFPERDVCVTYVLKYNYETKTLDLIDANTDLVYTLGEKMTKAALNTLLGMGTVFVVLVLISLIIYSFKLIPQIQEMFSGKKTVEAEKKEDTVVTQIEQREEQQLTDDLELVAVISAAVAASMGTTTNGFVVRSIRRR